MLVRISASPDAERGPEFMQRAFAAMHQANKQRVPFTLEYGRLVGTVSLFVRFPPQLRPYIETPLVANYPDIAMQRVAEAALDPPSEHSQWSVTVRLKPDLFPIKRPEECEESDPIAGLLATLAVGNNDPTVSRLQLRVQPLPSRCLRVWTSKHLVRVLDRPLFRSHDLLADLFKTLVSSRFTVVRIAAVGIGLFIPKGAASVKLHSTPQSGHTAEDLLQAAMLKLGSHLFDVQLTVTVSAPLSASAKARSKLRELVGALGAYTLPYFATFKAGRVRRQRGSVGRRAWWLGQETGHSKLRLATTGVKKLATATSTWPRLPRRGFLLSHEELATLFHPATLNVQTPTIQQSAFRELEPPIDLSASERGSGGVVELGQVSFRNASQRFGLGLDDRRRHLFVVGKTGMGKSTLLLNMFASDMSRGHGAGLIDVHGDLAEAGLRYVPRHRTQDVTYFDAGDRDHPLGYNPLRCRSQHERPHVASAVVASFKKMFGDSWGPRLENILRNSVLAVLETRDPTLSCIMRLLTDTPYRKGLVGKLENAMVKELRRSCQKHRADQPPRDSVRFSRSSREPQAIAKRLMTNPVLKQPDHVWHRRAAGCQA